MYRLMASLLNGVWTLGMLAGVAIGVQAVQNDQPPVRPAPPVAEPPIDETARLIKENRQLKRQLVEAAAEAQEAPGTGQTQGADSQAIKPQVTEPQDWRVTTTPMTYGPDGTFVTLDEYYRLHPQASPHYRSNQPRPKWRYREPTCTPSRAQLAWARMLPNHDGLASRGLSDKEIVQYFAPSEVKALEGDEVPEHLRPDIRPAVVYINERCLDGTCTTGYCEASKRNFGCQDGVCPASGK